MNKLDDFFDKEYDKKTTPDSNIANGQGNPYQWNMTPPPVNSSNKSITVLLLCITLVFVFAMGFLCAVLIGNNDHGEDAIIDEVLSALRNEYYFDISDEEWNKIVADGGTALLQGVDRYGRLLDPQSSYDLIEAPIVSTIGTTAYGMSFQLIQGIGMYILDTIQESNAFGRLEGEDFVVKLERGDKTLVTADATEEQVKDILDTTDKVTFHIVRQGVSMTTTFAKGKIGSDNNINKMQYVSYYFGDDVTNLSTTTEAGRSTNMKEYKHLDKLSNSVGYVSISEFSGDQSSSAYTEMQTAMDLFRDSGKSRLILDLKGNPGGSVDIVSHIAGLLSTTNYIDQELVAGVTNDSNQLITTTLYDNKDNAQEFFVDSKYDEYFGNKIDDKCNIVILTDANSASASELLTGVLTDYNTAIQMGTNTFGKGIAQGTIPLQYTGKITDSEGSTRDYQWHLYMTFARYDSPMGINIHGKGYKPDEQYDNLTTYEQLIDKAMEYWAK